MNVQSLAKAATQKRPFANRWAYLPISLVAAFFALYGWGDEGLFAACPYVFLLLVCVFQVFRPTWLGWGVLFSLSAVYAVMVAFSPQNGRPGEYVFFFLCGVVPAAVLLFLRPSTRTKDQH